MRGQEDLLTSASELVGVLTVGVEHRQPVRQGAELALDRDAGGPRGAPRASRCR
jgi:hypothetical protein